MRTPRYQDSQTFVTRSSMSDVHRLLRWCPKEPDQIPHSSSVASVQGDFEVGTRTMRQLEETSVSAILSAGFWNKADTTGTCVTIRTVIKRIWLLKGHTGHMISSLRLIHADWLHRLSLTTPALLASGTGPSCQRAQFRCGVPTMLKCLSMYSDEQCILCASLQFERRQSKHTASQQLTSNLDGFHSMHKQGIQPEQLSICHFCWIFTSRPYLFDFRPTLLILPLQNCSFSTAMDQARLCL